MPRPPVKRSKLNHPNQAAKRVTNNPLDSSPAARHRQVQEQLAHKDIGRVPNDSDDTDRLVTRSRTPRNRRGIPRREIYGSGGVAEGDQIAAHKSSTRTRQDVPPTQPSRVSAQANDARKATVPPRRGLDAVDRLSALKPAESVRATAAAAPTSEGPSPLGLMSSASSRILTQQTPAAERSILGPVRIRKRQPSILQSIDAPDSPILDEYLDDFLPNNESTPLSTSRKRKLPHTTTSSTPAPRAQSTQQTNIFETCMKSTVIPEPCLPPAVSSPMSQRRKPLSELDSDAMAPPRSSSSSAPSPVKTKKPSPHKKVNTRSAQEPRSLSTTALQALMPAKRQQRPRRAQVVMAKSEFDIPEDSSDARDDVIKDRTGDSDGEESYHVSPRATKGGKGKAREKLRNGKKSSTVIREQISANSKPQRKGRSSRPRKASMEPPSIPRATAAKISSQQQRPAQTSKSVRAYSRRADKHRSQTFAGVEEEDDKENRPSASFGGSSKRERGRSPGRENGLALRNESSAPGSDNDDIEIEVGRGDVTEMSGDGEGEQARLAKKFQEVDEWELEFEDVTFHGEGNDSLAR